jgi:hypothetical protein
MKAIRSISAVFLAILVLVSSTSFTVGMHFCKGVVENVNLFGKAESCQVEKSRPACHKHFKQGCCADELVSHEPSDVKASVKQIQFDVPAAIYIEQPAVLISEVIPSADVSRTQFHNYDPPLRSSDRNVSLQIFLI